jgi:hypothetical protein
VECADTDAFFNVTEEAYSTEEDVEELNVAGFVEMDTKGPKDTSSELADAPVGL